MFEENIFSNTFSEIKCICYRKRCGWFSNNVKTGNVRRHTLRRLAKLVVTIYTIKIKYWDQILNYMLYLRYIRATNV